MSYFDTGKSIATEKNVESKKQTLTEDLVGTGTRNAPKSDLAHLKVIFLQRQATGRREE